MTRQLGAEGAPHGIRANSINSGNIDVPAIARLSAEENLQNAVLAPLLVLTSPIWGRELCLVQPVHHDSGRNAAEPDLIPVGIVVDHLARAALVDFLGGGPDAPAGDLGHPDVEVVDHDRHQGDSGALGPLHDVDPPVLVEAPHGLGVVRKKAGGAPSSRSYQACAAAKSLTGMPAKRSTAISRSSTTAADVLG